MSFTKLLKSLCTIQTLSTTQTGTGDVTKTWTDAYTNVPTRYSRSKDPSVVQGTYQITLSDYNFYFEIGVDINIDDQIIVDGKTFEVRFVSEDSSHHHQKVIGRIKDFD